MFGDVHSAQAAVSLLVILHRYTFHCRPLVAVANSRVKAAVRSTGKVELARVTGGLPGRIVAKLEIRNPCGSMKDAWVSP